MWGCQRAKGLINVVRRVYHPGNMIVVKLMHRAARRVGISKARIDLSMPDDAKYLQLAHL